MKVLAPMALACFATVCGCGPVIYVDYGSSGAATVYGPFEAPPEKVWEATRGVLADMDFKFAKVDRAEWSLQSRWQACGTEWSHENHRNRVTLELESAGSGTEMHLLVETQVNSNTDPMRPTEADWAQEDPDLDMQNEIAYRVRNLLGEKVDVLDRQRPEESSAPRAK